MFLSKTIETVSDSVGREDDCVEVSDCKVDTDGVGNEGRGGGAGGIGETAAEEGGGGEGVELSGDGDGEAVEDEDGEFLSF